MTRFRRQRRLSAILLLAAVVIVIGQAWFLALGGPVHGTDDLDETESQALWLRLCRDEPGTPSSITGEHGNHFGGTLLTVAANFGDIHSGSIVAVTEESFGWPFRALKSRADFRGAAGNPIMSKAIAGAMLIGHEPAQLSGSFTLNIATNAIALPLRPVWLGFTANGMIAFLALSTFATLSRRARRSWRVKAGRCPDCGHPIGRSPLCAECGQPTPARPVS